MLITPFPIDFEWHSTHECPNLPSPDASMILNEGSLTALLKSQSDLFRVDVLREQWLASDSLHKNLLGQQCRQIQCREVLLVCDDVARVYAQSWISTQASDLGVRQLGSRPLGEVLFQDESWQRSELEVACVNNHSGYDALLNDLQLPLHNMYARRRVFTNREAKIMVCEVFLPKVNYATQLAK
ncbi:chorismate--pyruvate lyase family protein [Pseudoalteromonas byunsanensis]|nr:chorismate lyase [Pseudoalteromonas byunsanensis]